MLDGVFPGARMFFSFTRLPRPPTPAPHEPKVEQHRRTHKET
jgi:hypothetical protein